MSTVTENKVLPKSFILSRDGKIRTNNSKCEVVGDYRVEHPRFDRRLRKYHRACELVETIYYIRFMGRKFSAYTKKEVREILASFVTTQKA